MRTLTVRGVTEADLPSTLRVRVDSWRAAYEGVIPPAYLDGLDPGTMLPRTREYLATLPTDQHFLVAEDADGTVVGFVLVGPERPSVEAAAGERKGWGEVHALYVHPDAWYTGAGAALLRAAVETLAADGHRQLSLWVLERNPRARAFYERQGWRPDGAVTELQLGGALLQELRYTRPAPLPETDTAVASSAAALSALPRPRVRA